MKDLREFYLTVKENDNILIKSAFSDTTNLLVVVPDDIYLVRETGMRSPVAKLCKDKEGNLRLTDIINGS